MRKSPIFLVLGLLFSITAWGQERCFLAFEQEKLLKKEGSECQQRFTPQSTFKIALSLMGFDSGILLDEHHPEWPYKKEYELYLNVWKYPHNPHSWIRDSCVWYSQVLTQKLGMKRFKEYVDAFHYGNQDVSGDQGKNNGLTHAWLSSSLAISPFEQLQFLQKIVKKQIPVRQNAFIHTKNILYIQELPGGWKLYGKTGNGRQIEKNSSQESSLQQGWFVGWIEKDGRVITFVNHLSDSRKKTSFASFRAKNEAINQLFFLIDALEK